MQSHSAAGSMNVIDQVAPVKTIPSRSKSPTHSGGFFDRYPMYYITGAYTNGAHKNVL